MEVSQMAQRITIDPITRIEGHLRVDVEVEGGKVSKAWSSGQMFRGLEIILKGRDPRDAWLFVQRICGVCTTVHALASVRAVENALQLQIPLNAQYIRNLVMSVHALHDHIVHFYALSALDWVDVVSALKADPVATQKLADSLSDWPGNSSKRFAAVKAKAQRDCRKRPARSLRQCVLGTPGDETAARGKSYGSLPLPGSPRLSRKATQALAIFTGKNPHIQNLSVGGVTCAINPDSDSALNMDRLYFVKQLIEDVRGFIQQVYLADVVAVGALYKDWLPYGAGVTNYLAAPDMFLNAEGTSF